MCAKRTEMHPLPLAWINVFLLHCDRAGTHAKRFKMQPSPPPSSLLFWIMYFVGAPGLQGSSRYIYVTHSLLADQWWWWWKK